MPIASTSIKQAIPFYHRYFLIHIWELDKFIKKSMKSKKILTCAMLLLGEIGAAQASDIHLYLSQPGLNAAKNSTIIEGGLPWSATEAQTTGSYSMETFDNDPVGSSSPGTWVIGDKSAGTVAIQSGNVWGGFENTPYLLPSDITITLKKPARYLGFWWASGVMGNRFQLLDSNDNVLVDSNINQLITFLNSSANLPALDGVTTYAKTQYYGNPFPPYMNGGGGEPYVYLNYVVNDTTGTGLVAIAKIRFMSPAGIFDIDNLAVMESAISAAQLPPSWVDTGITAKFASPITLDDAYTTTQNQSKNFTPLSNDPDIPADSTVTMQGASSHGGTVVASGIGEWTYTPPVDFVGIDTFTYTVCLPAPEQTKCSTAKETITIPPTALPSISSTAEGIPKNGVLPTPANGGPFIYSGAPSSTKGGSVSIDPNSGEYVYTPPAGFTGIDSFNYTICLADAPTVCSTSVVTMSVYGLTAQNSSAHTSPNTPISSSEPIPSLSNAPADTTYDYALETPPNNGSVVMNPDGTYIYTPNPGFTGVDTFRYKVCTKDLTPAACSVATTTINVDGIIAAQPSSVQTTVNSPVDAKAPPPVESNIPAGTTYAYSTTSNPTHGSVTMSSDGSYIYTPTNGYSGEDSFEYQVCVVGATPAICSTAVITVKVLSISSATPVPTMKGLALFLLIGSMGILGIARIRRHFL
ncbi:Ig-like domain-containing protein [Comamonas sp. 4034]|uniref:Ig-like domain-containing protein n=1 Tax=Comamonas sp. 4034 TaxID=3156455 RepID=UPI003D21ED8B